MAFQNLTQVLRKTILGRVGEREGTQKEEMGEFSLPYVFENISTFPLPDYLLRGLQGYETS